MVQLLQNIGGKSINVEALPPVKGSKRKYMIQWQPVVGKTGGCITANADGTYSTPICNANINKQQWFIKEVKDEEQYLELIPRDRQSMGRSMDETEFPSILFRVPSLRIIVYIMREEVLP